MQTTHNWARADFMVVNTKTCQVETSKFIYVHFIQAGDKNNKFNWIDFKCKNDPNGDTGLQTVQDSHLDLLHFRPMLK